MLAQLRFSHAEQERQQPDPETVEQAFERFSKEGYLVLPEIFPPEVIDKLHSSFLATYSRYCTHENHADALLVGNRRVMVTVRLEGPFNDPLLYIDNWLTCVSNLGHSFIIDGRKVKSFNQWYNRQLARLRTGKPQGFWSQQLNRITEKRNRRMRDAIHKAARLVIDYCLKHSIGKVIFGWNKGQKQECQMGNINNQNFVAVPTGRLKERIMALPSLRWMKRTARRRVSWMGMSYPTPVKNPTGGKPLESE